MYFVNIFCFKWRNLFMTFYAHLVFSVAENALDASAALSSGIAQKKSHATTSQCGFTADAERGSWYCTIFVFIPQCLSRTGCYFVFRLGLWNKLVLRHIMYYRISEDVQCRASLSHRSATISTHQSRTQALYKHFERTKNINISILGSLAVVPKHGLAIGTIKKKKRYCSCT